MKDFKGNVRFLFLTQECQSIDISKALANIDKKVIDSKNLNFYESYIILEFFTHPKEKNFLDSSLNLGRYITGYEQQVFNEFDFKDYTQTQEKSFPIKLESSWKELFQGVSQLLPESISSWKIVISSDFSEYKVIFCEA